MDKKPKMFTVPSGAKVPITEQNYITTEVVLDLSDVIHGNLENFLDLISMGATDTEVLSDINYNLDRLNSWGGMVFIVTGDISEVLETEG